MFFLGHSAHRSPTYLLHNGVKTFFFKFWIIAVFWPNFRSNSDWRNFKKRHKITTLYFNLVFFFHFFVQSFADESRILQKIRSEYQLNHIIPIFQTKFDKKKVIIRFDSKKMLPHCVGVSWRDCYGFLWFYDGGAPI